MALCTRANIEAIFGTDNVAKWANLGGSDSEATVTARITQAIAVAEAKALAILAGGPHSLTRLAANPPTLVVDAVATLAGVWLYECRGLQDYSADRREGSAGRHRLAGNEEKALQTLELIRDGKLKVTV